LSAVHSGADDLSLHSFRDGSVTGAPHRRVRDDVMRLQPFCAILQRKERFDGPSIAAHCRTFDRQRLGAVCPTDPLGDSQPALIRTGGLGSIPDPPRAGRASPGRDHGLASIILVCRDE